VYKSRDLAGLTGPCSNGVDRVESATVAGKPLLDISLRCCDCCRNIAIPAVVSAVLRMSGGLLKKLGSPRCLLREACLGHCADFVLVGALATAIA